MKLGAAKSKKENKSLIAVLIILVLLAVGLIVGIVIGVLNNKPVEDGQKPDDSYIEVGDKRGVLKSIRNHLKNVEIEEALVFLDEEIEKYKNSNIGVDVRLIKANYLKEIDEYEETFKVLDDLMSEDLDPRDKMDVLLVYSNTYKRMGNEEKTQEYQNKYWEEYLKYYDGGAGIE